MLNYRIMPVLLLDDCGLYKTEKFKSGRYIGDPVNAVRIFNEKEVDEIILLDIGPHKGSPAMSDFEISKITSEAFVPLTYGGGISSVEHGRRLLELGIEKIAVNTHALGDSNLVRQLSNEFGSSSVVVSIDVKKRRGEYVVRSSGGTGKTKLSAIQWAQMAENLGAGELLVNSIDRDGTMEGLDLELMRQIVGSVDIPVVGAGGASSINDLCAGIVDAGLSGVAAGSLFLFHGPHRAVLINFPNRLEFEDALESAQHTRF